jgi:hypothetical protein
VRGCDKEARLGTVLLAPMLKWTGLHREHDGDSSRLNGDLPHCLASLSASTQDKPTTYGDHNQCDPLAVSRLLWLIVALRTPPSKGFLAVQ